MKTMKRMITVIAVLLSAQVITASDIKIRTNENAEIVIEASELTGEEHIRIFDEEGTLLFYEVINERTYLKTFKLSTLPNGKYFVKYENESKINTAVIVKNGDHAEVTSDFNRVSFKPMIKQDHKFLNVGITNPQLENVRISIKDENGYELTEIKNLNDLVVKKTFNTTKLPKGQYSVQVNIGNQSFTKMVAVH